MNRKFHSPQGFTLVEVMVSVSIFVLITTIGIGALMNINNAYKQSRSQRIAIDSLNFVLDSMSRQIRTTHHLHLLNVTIHQVHRHFTLLIRKNVRLLIAL